MRELKGRVAVVTGAAGGLGRGLAETFAAAGMRIVLADSHAERLQAATDGVRAMGAEAIGVPTDVGSEAAVQALGAAAMEHFGSVSVLCNNAGIWGMGSLWEISVADWRRMIDVNLWGVIYGLRTFVPLILKNEEGGHVVNTSSIGGLIGSAYRAPYAATKHAVVGISQSLRDEARDRGLKLGVTVACPGKVDTNIFGGFAAAEAASDPALRESLRKSAAVLEEEPSISPRAAGETIRDAILADQFYVLPGVSGRGRTRVEAEFGSILDAWG